MSMSPDLKAGAQPIARSASELPLEDRVRLLTGMTPWMLYPLPAIGLHSIVLSDGPNGVRGVEEDTTRSAQLPSPTAISASWDLDLVTRLGTLVASEAQRKRADVVLAPVANLQRTPVGGRHFECYSEDPYLTGRVVASYIASVQEHGVGMCVKHFIGNESETDRTSYIARIDERTMREVYLAPFELAVREAGVWSVMAAYNQVDDGILSAPATEHFRMLIDLLKNEWGFDGVVVSDWLATSSTLESANGGLDLVMPGPGGPWGEKLLAAVRAGDVPEGMIDDKVRRIIRLGERVGALETDQVDAARDQVPVDLPAAADTRTLLREAVARSMVVLRNENGLLPLRPDALTSVALIGPNAIEPFVQGGGSAFVHAPYLSLPADALREALPGVQISTHRGCAARKHAPVIDRGLVATPDGTPGYELTLLDTAGRPLAPPATITATEGWNRHISTSAATARIRAIVQLEKPGMHRIELGLSGAHTVRFNDELVSESSRIAGGDVILDSSANHPEGPSRSYQGPGAVRIDADVQVVDAQGFGTFARFALRHEPDALTPEDELAAAVDAAAAADVAIVIIGTNEETESEGWDRPSLDLPGRQNELVRRVSEANPDTVVVVNAGAPVLLPWLDGVAATLWWWLPGQEAGNGLADAILGIIEPSGHLPWTLPADAGDVPIPNALPVNGILDYTEGVHVGHRGWDLLERDPARCFGYGQGYTTFEYGVPAPSGWSTASGNAEFVVEVTVANTGERSGRATVQAYLEDLARPASRPVRWLAAFASAEVAVLERGSVELRMPRRAFETWDTASHSWIFVEGLYAVRVGGSSRDLPVEVIVDMTRPADPGTPTNQ